MGRAIAVRTDYSSAELRALAKRLKNAAQVRRLLALAAVLDGASREAAARIGGMDRQTLRDWVTRFNEDSTDGLLNLASPGAPSKLGAAHKAFLARMIEEGPVPAVDGVVRWRACDLIMRLLEEFGLSVSDDTVYRALKDPGYAHVSARPRAYRQDAEARAAFKKTSPPGWRKSANASRPIPRWKSGSRMRCGLARRTSSPTVGRRKVHGPQLITISAPSRPISSAPCAPNGERARRWYYRSATPKR